MARRRNAARRDKDAAQRVSYLWDRTLGLRQCHAALALVLAAAIPVRGLADFVGFEEQHLRHALVGVDLRRQRGRIGKLQGDVPFPLRFQRRYVAYYSATRVGRIVDDEI